MVETILAALALHYPTTTALDDFPDVPRTSEYDLGGFSLAVGGRLLLVRIAGLLTFPGRQQRCAAASTI
jgi:hypothetical protein